VRGIIYGIGDGRSGYNARRLDDSFANSENGSVDSCVYGWGYEAMPRWWCGQYRGLLDDYRVWRERDPELKSLTASDPEDPDS